MEFIDEKDFSEDTKYNLPGGKIKVMAMGEITTYDLVMMISYDNYVMSVGYKLNEGFNIISFGSNDWLSAITANDFTDAELLVRLLTPSLKEYAQKIMNTRPTKKSNIIIGNN